jgi:prepilin-type N-terminal cleavage/methylation domain-containing protein
MRAHPPIPHAANRAFSLVELLVSVGLLSIVILALYAMFDQTQRALRGSVGQVDVLEGARSAIDLVRRDLEQARPAGVLDGPHLVTRVSAAPSLVLNQTSLFQERQPVLQEFFGIRSVADRQWSAFGYFIADESNPTLRTRPPIGTLYRYEDRGPGPRIPGEAILTNSAIRFIVRGPTALATLEEHVLARTGVGAGMGSIIPYRTNASRVLDGVLNFKVTAFDSVGRPFNIFYPTNQLPARPANGTIPPIGLRHLSGGLVTEASFTGPYMPAYVEVEVDALEPRLLDQYRALPDNPAIRNRYITNNLARVQSFRQRIPLRSFIR